METDAFSIEALFDFLSAAPRIISIIGMEKNVGKTTLLNFLLQGMHERSLSTLVLSIGRDGESLDAVENTPKPAIMIYKGGCFLTIKELIKTPSAVEILECFDLTVSGSRVILGRALQDTQVQLVNPSNLTMLSKVIHQSVKCCGRCTVFIDGALNRLSHGSSSLINGVFVCTGVQVDGDVSRIIGKTESLVANLENIACDEEIKKLILKNVFNWGILLIRDHRIIDCITGTLLDTTDLDKKIKNNDIIYTTGVITDTIIREFIDKELSVTIVLVDGTKCHISQRFGAMIKRRGIQIRVLNPIPVYGLAVNSVGIRRSMNPSKVLRAFRHAFKDKWVFDTTYLE